MHHIIDSWAIYCKKYYVNEQMKKMIMHRSKQICDVIISSEKSNDFFNQFLVQIYWLCYPIFKHMYLQIYHTLVQENSF